MRQKGQECRRCASPRAGLFPAVRRRGHILTASPSRPPMISGNPSQQRNTRDAPGIRTRLRRLCRPPPTTSETCVTSGPRRSRTPACSLGQSRAVPCTMSPWRSQQESNLRRHLRWVASYPLDHRSLVRRDGLEPSCGMPGLQPGAVAAAPPTRGVPYRIRTGQSSGHSRVPQPLGSRHQSIRQDSNLREAVCGTAALPLSY
jgi:hypothetical protein